MAKAFCIIPELAEKLKKAAQAGEIDIKQMFDMSSAERRALFEKYSDKETATQINTGFEKAMVSSQKQALANWAKRTFNPEQKKLGRFQSVSDKIDELNSLLTPAEEKAFLEDLVAEKLGIRVSAEEAKIISEKATKLQESINLMNNELGNPTAKTEVQMQYAKAREDIDNYIKSLTPQSNVRVLTSIVGRGMMLARFGSATVNIVSNSVQGIKQFIDRRIVNKSAGGLNSDLIKAYVDNNLKIFNTSGLDTSRMLTIEREQMIHGERITHSQGSGPIRKMGRVVEKAVFRYTQGSPDVAFASLAFADRANITSSKIAFKMGLKGTEAKIKAREIMIDAMRVEPKTKEGKLVREESIADSTYSTGTHDSATSKAALKVRDALNEFSGDIRAGDLTTPFVKTPANFIQISIENSGVLVVPKGGIRLWNAVTKAKEMGTKESFEEAFAGYGEEVVRAGTGIIFSAALVYTINPSDFIGAYPTNQTEQDLLTSKKATTNSIRIGDRWISLDYFGPLKGAMVGFLYQRKYGGSLEDRVWTYLKSVGLEASGIPGFSDFVSEIRKLQEQPGVNTQAKQGIHDAALYAVNFIQARTIPGFVSDFAKSIDPYQRKADKGDLLGNVKANIPFLRKTLPIAKNIFGEDIASQGFTQFFLGSRLKQGETNAVYEELTRLATVGQLPSVNNIEDHGTKAKELKVQIGETQFNKALEYYGSMLKSDLTDLLQDQDYIDATDEEKKKLINDIQDEDYADMLDTFGYEKPEKQ